MNEECYLVYEKRDDFSITPSSGLRGITNSLLININNLL